MTSSALAGLDDQFFRVISSTRDYARISARFHAQRSKLTRVAAVLDLSNAAYTERWLEDFEAEFRQLGGQVVARDDRLLQPFVDCLKELPATLLLRPLNVETLSTYIYQFATRGSFEEGALAGVLLVLAILTDGGVLEDLVATTYLGRAIDHHMRAYPGVFADFNLGADDRKGADFNPFANHRRLMDDGSIVNDGSLVDHVY